MLSVALVHSNSQCPKRGLYRSRTQDSLQLVKGLGFTHCVEPIFAAFAFLYYVKVLPLRLDISKFSVGFGNRRMP
jgi:hypothetical protein